MEPNESGELIPFQGLLEELFATHRFTQDRWESWCKVELMRPLTERIKGSFAYGISAAEEMRLRALVSLDTELSGRRTPKKLAYYAALSETCDVPVNLVLEYVEDSVRFAYGQARRYINRVCDGKFEVAFLTGERVRHLAEELANRVIKGVPIPPEQFAEVRAFFRDAWFILISLAFTKTPPHVLESRLRSLIRGVLTDDVSRAGWEAIRKAFLRDAAAFVDPRLGRNSVLDDIAKAINDPHALKRALADTRAFVGACLQKFGDPLLSPKKFPDHPTPREATGIRAFLFMFPAITAIMLQSELHDPTSRHLTQLRESAGQHVLELLTSMETLAETYLRSHSVR